MTESRHRVRRSKDAPRGVPRWQRVENVVAAIEHALGSAPGWTIRQNAMVLQRHSTRRRQVDVYVECPSGHRTFAVGVDVKDTRSPLDVEAIEQLCAKGKSLALDRYVIISTGGFTAQGLEEALRHGVATQELHALDFSEMFALDSFTQLVAESSDVELLFESQPSALTASDLESAQLLIDGVGHDIRVLAGAYARQEFERDPQVPVGVARILEVRDFSKVWEAMRIREQTMAAPMALRVRWTPRVVQIPGHKFRTADGVEVFTAILPGPGDARQISLVATPQADGSKQLMLTVQNPTPSRVTI